MTEKRKKSKETSRLPVRSTAHITGERAVLELRRSLPKEWIVREVSSDYGIDCEIEVVDADSLVTGAMILAQVKGTEGSQPSQKNIVQVKSSTIRYWALLPLPVIIVRVVENPVQVLWLDALQHLKDTERYDGLFVSKQLTASFNFSKAAVIPASLEALRELATDHQMQVAAMREGNDQRLVGDFIGYHILIHVFDGDADRWMQWLRTEGSDEQIIHDYPVAAWVKSQQETDPEFIERLRRLVENTNLDGSKRNNS
jgi:hypothetical protein